MSHLLRLFKPLLLSIAAATVISAAGAFAQAPNSTLLSTKELAQGYRDSTILAMPLAASRATVDADEAAEGWTVEQNFARFGGLRVIAVKQGDTPDASIRRLSATGRYAFVQHDYVKRAFATPDDPSFSSQWGLNNTGNNPNIPGPGVAGADIHAVAAWDTRHDAPNVVVGIVDSGLLLTHSDIVANLWTNPSPNGTTSNGFRYVNAVHGINATVSSGSTNSGNPSDDNGHGTHVSGIIGAVGNNGIDVCGVAWTVQLMPLKFLDANGNGSTSAEVSCLDFAIAHGANILNGSFGSSVYDPSELAALQALDAAGIIFVAAAGNAAEDNDLTPGYPASYPLDNIVAVAASDNRDDVVFFSSCGSGDVDLAAPGYNILSLYNADNTATATLSGTSMAAPFVTGSLALLKAQFPSDTSRQLINRLLRHVDSNINFIDRVQTGGRLDLDAAINSAPGDNTPFNDFFANRGHLAGSSLIVRASNTGATLEPGEPQIAGTAGGASLWWDWTAPVSGSVTLTTTGSAYETLLAIYTGTSLSGLSSVVSNASPGIGASTVTFQAEAGTTYDFTVDGQNGANGLTVLNLNYDNDSSTRAAQLSGLSIGVTTTNRNANLSISAGNPVWYSWTAQETGQFQVGAVSYAFDPVLAVYTGASAGSLSLVASAAGPAINSNADAPTSNCLCTLKATAGTTYWITANGAHDASTDLSAGQFTLTIADSLWQGVAGDAITSAPTVGPDGTVYVGSDDGIFYAFNPGGSIKWTYNTNSTSATGSFDTTSAAIGEDGTVYAASNLYDNTTSNVTGVVYAFTPTGTVKWSHAIPTPSDPTLTGEVDSPPALASVTTPDDTLYIKAEDSFLFALNTADGSVKWTYPVPGVSYAAPSIASDGTVYIGSDNNTLYALTPTGSLKWSFTAASSIYNGAAIDAGGNLYFGTLGGNFYALNSAGQQLWSFTANNSISSSPVLGANGAVYFGSYDHHLYALSTATGALLWGARLGSEVRASSPVVDANGVVYVGCYDNNLYAINPDGSLNRIFATGDWVRSSPVLFGTNLYFGSNDHKLYAFSIGAGLASSPWPVYMGSPSRLGRASASHAPTIAVQPAGQTIASRSTAVFSISANGTPAPTYQWQLNGVNLAGATSSRLVISGATAANTGAYTCVVTNSAGSVTSNAAILVVTTASNPGRLINLSVNAFDGTGNQAMTVGFVTGGAGTSGSQTLLIRASGPALIPYGVSGILSDPKLTVFNGSTAVTSNAGWGTPATNVALVQAAEANTGAGLVYTSPSSLDSAVVIPLAPNPGYTVQIAGASGDSGRTLAEVYDDTPTGTYALSTPRLINVSCRIQVAASSSLTEGFIIGGTTSKTVLIRAIGPGLTAYGVGGVMPDPQLTVYAGQTVLASNAGWGGDPQLTAVATAVQAQPNPPASADSVVLLTLAPGAYTAVASSAGSTAGNVLVDIYEVP